MPSDDATKLDNWEIWAFDRESFKGRKGINIESVLIPDGVSINMNLSKEEIEKFRDFLNELIDNWDK